jgi:hypothetical protein
VYEAVTARSPGADVVIHLEPMPLKMIMSLSFVTAIFVKLKNMEECTGRETDNMVAAITVNLVSNVTRRFWVTLCMPENLGGRKSKL